MISAKSPDFDVSKHIRLVLPFQQKQVDKYFIHFEKLLLARNGQRKSGPCYYKAY